MKCYYPTDKSGNRIGFKTPEACIFDTSGTNLTKKLNQLRSDVNGKAAASHGHHVPTPQSANNKVYLRNDNTWHTLTPADIGAAASSHSHSWDSITGKPSLYTTSQIDSKISAINSNISDKIKILVTKSTVLQGQYWEAGEYLGRKFNIHLTIPSGYTPYNIDANIQGSDRFKINFDNFSDISSSSPNVYITHLFHESITINPTDEPPVFVIITTLLIKN